MARLVRGLTVQHFPGAGSISRSRRPFGLWLSFYRAISAKRGRLSVEVSRLPTH